MDELMEMGHAEIVASHLANLVTTGRPQLAAVGAQVLAQSLPAEKVRCACLCYYLAAA